MNKMIAIFDEHFLSKAFVYLLEGKLEFEIIDKNFTLELKDIISNIKSNKDGALMFREEIFENGDMLLVSRSVNVDDENYIFALNDFLVSRGLSCFIVFEEAKDLLISLTKIEEKDGKRERLWRDIINIDEVGLLAVQEAFASVVK